MNDVLNITRYAVANIIRELTACEGTSEDILNAKLVDFNFDSLDLVELIMELEEEFDIIIPDELADKYVNEEVSPTSATTVNDLANFIFVFANKEITVKEKHPTELEFGDLKTIAVAIAGMRYDKVIEFINYLKEDLERQSAGDKAKGRVMLSQRLDNTVAKLGEANEEMKIAWKICGYFMGMGENNETTKNECL